MFEIAALLALRHGGRVKVRNHPLIVGDRAKRTDPLDARSEHPGHFLLRAGPNDVLVAGDGRVLSPSAPSLWERYMAGEDPLSLTASLEALLGHRPSAKRPVA